MNTDRNISKLREHVLNHLFLSSVVHISDCQIVFLLCLKPQVAVLSVVDSRFVVLVLLEPRFVQFQVGNQLVSSNVSEHGLAVNLRAEDVI